jgi:hypothetical protein
MNAGLDQLIDSIADVLWAGVKAQHLPATCVALGLNGGEESEAFGSKRGYVRKRLVGWSKEKLVDLADKVLETFPSDSLQRIIEQLTPNEPNRISEITRQHLFRDVFALGPLEGKLDILAFLERLWPVASMPSSGNDYRCANAKEEICQHMLTNNDYSYGDMFELLGFVNMSNKKLVEFLEWTVHPLVRVELEQDRYVKSVNDHLRQDGLALVASETVSGFPVLLPGRGRRT